MTNSKYEDFFFIEHFQEYITLYYINNYFLYIFRVLAFKLFKTNIKFKVISKNGFIA